MMKQDDLVIVEPIIEKLIQMIAAGDRLTPLEAMDRFYHSQTYEMLITPELYLWDFSDRAIYDMWMSEQRTGDPRNSLYIAGGAEHER